MSRRAVVARISVVVIVRHLDISTADDDCCAVDKNGARDQRSAGLSMRTKWGRGTVIRRARRRNQTSASAHATESDIDAVAVKMLVHDTARSSDMYTT